MNNERLDILYKVYEKEITPEQAYDKLLRLSNVGVMLPTGLDSLNEKDDTRWDLYALDKSLDMTSFGAGWSCCFDWINKRFKGN